MMPKIDSSQPEHYGYTGTLYVGYPVPEEMPSRRMCLEDIISRGNAFYANMTQKNEQRKG